MTRQPQQGTGVDAMGGPVIDPTKNVLDLVGAGATRQDDLRELTNRLVEAKIEVLAVKVNAAEKEMVLRSEHAREIRALESGATSLASARALTAIETLASQTTGTATTIAAQLSETIAGLVGRIAQLEKSSYEGAGKQAVADPMMAEMVSELKALRLSVVGQQNQTTGQGAGTEKTIKYAVIALGALVSLMTLGGMVIGIAFAVRAAQ